MLSKRFDNGGFGESFNSVMQNYVSITENKKFKPYYLKGPLVPKYFT